jgi:hypothetical protein
VATVEYAAIMDAERVLRRLLREHLRGRLAMKLAISIITLCMAGSAFAAADQTQPGASHGPTTVSPSTVDSPGTDSGAGGGKATGGMPNGTSAAGKGTAQGSGGMQPRIEKGDSNTSTPRSTNGNAQGL